MRVLRVASPQGSIMMPTSQAEGDALRYISCPHVPPCLLTVSAYHNCASSMAGVEYLNELRRERPGMGRNRHHAATQPGLPSIASLLSGGSRAGDDYPYGLAGVGG